MLIGAIYGLSDEWHQSFVPGRDCSVYDVAADALGVLSAVVTFKMVRYGWRRLRNLENRMERGLKDD